MAFEELPWCPNNHHVSNFNISKTFKDVLSTLQNFTFIGTTVSEIAGGPALGSNMIVCDPEGGFNAFLLQFDHKIKTVNFQSPFCTRLIPQ